MNDAILGLDIGTTATKAVLFDRSGTEVATAERAYRLHTPQPGWVEQNPEDPVLVANLVWALDYGPSRDPALVDPLGAAAQDAEMLFVRDFVAQVTLEERGGDGGDAHPGLVQNEPHLLPVW